ncbi:hypothetical protein GCM10010831_01930 [Psychroflexus salis]|uniref:Uncharacterized protein n=1 Tax=Psychroflexus salis TaxID=1526574 RepID=A0A916ZN84_9FLAO|nr:hypothetical protein GCM10010831_01930 [Psychroflexus salis]
MSKNETQKHHKINLMKALKDVVVCFLVNSIKIYKKENYETKNIFGNCPSDNFHEQLCRN